MAYAQIQDIEKRTGKTIAQSEQLKYQDMLDEASAIVDSYNSKAKADDKKIVVCRMVARAMSTGADMPLGVAQGTVAALGYSQTYTFQNGTSGELYVSKLEKKLLGCGNKIGCSNPYEVKHD